MPKYNNPINSFSSGELGPKTISRFDIDEYAQGAELVQNMIPYKSGGVTRRPGTKHLAKVSTVIGSGNTLSGLYPFVFSQLEAYCVVITPNNNAPDSAIQIFKRDGSIATVVYNTGGLNYFTLPAFDGSLEATGFQYAQSGDILYFVHSSGTYPPFIIKRLAEDSFEVQHIWGLGEIYEPALTNTYRSPNIDAEKNLYFDSATTIADYIAQKGTLNTRTVFSVDSSNNPIDTVFDPSHEGSIWRCTSGTAKECVFYIQTVAPDQRSATVLMLVGMDGLLVGTGNKSNNWNEGQWSDLRGWPRTITFFQQRLILGGNIEKPDTLWMSKLGNYKNFMSDKLDQDTASTDYSGLDHFNIITNADPFNATIASTEVNDIAWLSSDSVMICGTIGAEYTISPIDGVFGRNNININPRSSYGSKPVQAFKGGEGVMYISRDGKRIRRFRNSADGEQSNVDITTLNSDIIHHNPNLLGTVASTEVKGITVKQMAWQESRSTMWFVTSNKALIGFTIDQKSGVAGWHRHEMSPANGNQAEILGVTVLPNETNTYLDIYVLVSRSVWINTEISLEKIGDDFEHTLLKNTSSNEDDHPHFSDSSVRYTAAEASATREFQPFWINVADNSITFSGKHRYHQGQEVRVTTDGVMPGGLSQVTDYYLIVESDITLYLADSPANAATGKSVAVNMTGTGSGTHSIVPTAVTTLTRWSGLNHLSNEPCRVLVDGVESDGTVGVQFELATGIGEYFDTVAAEEIIIGLPYKSRLETMPLESGAPGQSVSRGNITRINRAVLHLYKSWAARFGSIDDDGSDILEDAELGTESYSGDITLDFPSSPDRLGKVVVETDSALPMSLLGMTLRGQDNQG